MNTLRTKRTFISIITLLVTTAVVLTQQILPNRVHAATLTVTNTADGGAGSLRQSIADAVSGDTIGFAPGLTGTITLITGELVINKNLTISGPGAKVLTVSGNNASRVFRIDSGSTVAISGLTIASGNVVDSGGGISNAGVLTVADCAISNNSAGVSGGGISNTGTLTITSCEISNNRAANGGGGTRNFAELTIVGSAIWNNSAFAGGGISNSIVGSLAISGSTISNNSAFSGGGISNSGDAFHSGDLDMTNCTVTGNRSTEFGGGIDFFVITGSETLNNTIVAGNFQGITPNDIGGTSGISASHNLIGDAGSALGITDGTDGNIVGVGGNGTRDINTILNTFLGDHGGPTPTHLLVCNSPAINAGDNTLAAPLATDQRGAPRVAAGTVDIGAVEMQNHVTNLNDSGAGSLRQEIADAASGGFVDVDPCVSGTITLTTGELFIDKSLTINGPGANRLTVSGNKASRVFRIDSGNTMLISALTIANGKTSGDGGGILNTGRLIISNCAVSNCSSGANGGGIFSVAGASLTITGSTVSNNSATSGGGILNSNSVLIVSNSTISNNAAINAGGGLWNGSGNGTLTATNCTITGNSASGGGGISAQRTETLNNTIVAGNFRYTNMAPNDIQIVNSSIEIANHNLIGDAATAGGILNGVNGNIVGVGGVGTRPINTILNTTLADNGGPTKTHALFCGSPAIDRGNNSFASDIDQRGSRRIFDGNSDSTSTVDIGAVEKESACPSITPQPVSVEKGSSSPALPVATVNDVEDAEDSLVVKVNGGASATVNGVTIESLQVAPNGNVTAGVSATCAAASATFTLSVTDSATQTVEATLSVTVTASAPPVLTCPGNITKSNDPGQCSAVVSFVTTVTDDCSTITPVCLPASGSAFAKGTTTVTCTATDSDSQVASCSFTVTVADSQMPSIACPANITAVTPVTGASTVVVNFATPSGSDNCGTPNVVCSPASGSAFPIGSTTVTCTATDGSGNTASCSFVVTTFDVCLQDDSNPGNVLLWNSVTGDYRFCCVGTPLTARGTPSRKGNLFTLTQYAGDLRLNGSVDASQNKGTASLQSPPGVNRCSITDRDTRNNSCQCAGS